MNQPGRWHPVFGMITPFRNMEYHYCSLCANRLETIVKDGKKRWYCSVCRKKHYRNPTVGVAAILFENERLLLVKRAAGVSYEGTWCIPCGHMEWGEDVRVAAAREFKEETGLDAAIGPVFAVHSNFHDPEQLTVGIWFWAIREKGEVKPGSDASRAAFFALDAIPENMAFPTDLLVIEQLKEYVRSGFGKHNFFGPDFNWFLNENERRQRMSKTDENLKEAFAGESQANRKYLAFAQAAEKEGYPQVAKLFRAAAAAETVHAHAHLRAMGGIGGTEENLKEAVAGETHEFKKMYPAMIEAAEQEGKKAAHRSFKYANEVEEVHANLYQKALDNMDSMEDVDYHVCSVCGYTCENEAPDSCPVCKAKKQAFFRVD